jgi:hypothetical protein
VVVQLLELRQRRISLFGKNRKGCGTYLRPQEPRLLNPADSIFGNWARAERPAEKMLDKREGND